MSVSSISFIKKISLIFGRKAYLVYTNNPFPSLLIPLPQIGSPLKSAIFKTFSDLTNDQILTFSNAKTAQKDSKNIEREKKAKINIEQNQFPQKINIDSIENIEIKPDSLFLTLNRQDHTLSFMPYEDLTCSKLSANAQSNEKPKKDEKPQKQQQNKKQKSQPEIRKKQEQFYKQKQFQKKQVNTWNGQSPELSNTNDPKQQASFIRQSKTINKFNQFVPLAYLTDHIVRKPIQIVHIQTSRQYLLLQLLKIFCLANILCVYNMINIGTRPQNHNQLRQK